MVRESTPGDAAAESAAVEPDGGRAASSAGRGFLARARGLVAGGVRDREEPRRLRERGETLARLEADPHPAVAAVGRALTAAVADPSPEESAWVARIEEARRELRGSNDLERVLRSEWTGDPARDRLPERVVARLEFAESRPDPWGRVVLCLVRELRPGTSLQLGTRLGLSAAYGAAGLELAGCPGRVIGIEAGEARVALARKNAARLGLVDQLALADRVEIRLRRPDETLDDALTGVEGVGLALIHGRGGEGSSMDRFTTVAERLRLPGVVMLDEDATFAEDGEEWAEIAGSPGVQAAIDVGGLGICVLDDLGPAAVRREPLVASLFPDR